MIYRSLRPSISAKSLAIVLFVSCVTNWTAVSAHAQTCYSGTQSVPVSSQAYTIQNNEWNSSAFECITVDTNATSFMVAQSSLSHTNTTRGNPDIPSGYPSIYKGCHWSNCTSNSGMPIQVSRIGAVSSSWTPQFSQVAGTDKFNVAYDIWFKQNGTPGTPDGA